MKQEGNRCQGVGSKRGMRQPLMLGMQNIRLECADRILGHAQVLVAQQSMRHVLN